MSERIKKITTAQAQAAAIDALPAIGEMVQSAAGAANDALKKSEEVAGENHKGDKKEPGDFINELNLSQQSGREQLVGFGIDKDKYNQYTKDLMDAGMPSQMTASKFIQDMASIASTAAIPFEDAFAVGKAIFRRNIYSPDRAVAILRVLAKYEDMAPGIGIFDMAKGAAMGQFNPHALTAVRFSLMGIPGFKGNMNQSRDLQQAFDGINAPNSQLGESLNETNMAHQRMQAVQEQMLLQARLINLMYQKERDKKLTEIYAYWAANLPDWVKNNKYMLDTLLRGMNGLATANAVKNSIMRGFGVGGDTGLGAGQSGQKSPGLGFIQADVKRERKVIAAGEAGTAPVDLGAGAAPVGGAAPAAGTAPVQPQGPTQEQLMNQNVNQANQGGENDVIQQSVMEGVITTQMGAEIKRLQALIATHKAALETNYNNLVEMLEAGAQPHSMFAQDFATATYVTPEQIAFYAEPASQNATVLVKLIQSLLTVFVQISSSISMKSLSGAGNSALFANLKNIEANWRQELKDAQKKRLQIFDISVLGPIDQQVRVLEPQYKQMESGMEMMAAFNNVGADAYVMPFAQIAQRMADLYNEASQQYKKAGAQIAHQEPAMAQYCKSRSDQMAAAAQQAMAKGVTALRNLMKQQSGGAIASTNDKFVRLAEETSEKEDELAVEDGEGAPTDVEAKPLPVDEYWDKLYKNDPPYGDVMVHPEKHRNEPSWKMRPKHRVKRLN